MNATKPNKSVTENMGMLADEQWQKLTVRNMINGKLTGYYHFAKIYIWNKVIDRIEQRLFVIRKTVSIDGQLDIKFLFTELNQEKYIPEVIARMQAQRFFVEHCIKESKQILGIDQFQTRKWNAWLHRTALNFMISSFILKKNQNNEDLPLLSARDIKELIKFQLYKQMTDDQMYEKIINRHVRRQKDINNAYLMQNLNLSKQIHFFYKKLPKKLK